MRNEADLSEGLNDEAEEKSENDDSSIFESQCHGESVAVEFAREEEERKKEEIEKRRLKIKKKINYYFIFIFNFRFRAKKIKKKIRK